MDRDVGRHRGKLFKRGLRLGGCIRKFGVRFGCIRVGGIREAGVCLGGVRVGSARKVGVRFSGVGVGGT